MGIGFLAVYTRHMRFAIIRKKHCESCSVCPQKKMSFHESWRYHFFLKEYHCHTLLPCMYFALFATSKKKEKKHDGLLDRIPIPLFCLNIFCCFSDSICAKQGKEMFILRLVLNMESTSTSSLIFNSKKKQQVKILWFRQIKKSCRLTYERSTYDLPRPSN